MEKKATQKNDDVASLYDCLDTFRTPEQLGEDNAWYCRTCKEHVQAKKKLDLFNVPPVLVISLKRFKSSRGGYFKDKLTDKVDFPVQGLDLTQYVCNNPDNEKVIYDLYGVTNHYGNMGFGHYTAYGFNVEQKQWYDFDDGHVSPMNDPEQVVTEAAYNLFYRKRGYFEERAIDYNSIKNEADILTAIDEINARNKKIEGKSPKKTETKAAPPAQTEEGSGGHEEMVLDD